MSQKKPIWTTTQAHERLKAYCQAAGRTQLEVVSELILTTLQADGKRAAQTATGSTSETKETSEKHFGGVWVV